jgi:hypothetical protein
MNTDTITPMKITKYLTLAFLTLGLGTAFSQPVVVGYDGQKDIVAESTNFTKFDLDFPGGGPKELVEAIKKATGKPLNVVILEEDSNVGLPMLKLKNIYLPELFQVIRAVSTKTEYVNMLNTQGFTSKESFIDSCEFYTLDRNAGPDSVWYFHVDRPGAVLNTAVKNCRFYQLGPYLDNGLKVDDITTAIRTGWDMEGCTDATRPQISFHKETRLLIAVGDPEKLAVIDGVLQSLNVQKFKPIIVDPSTGLPVSGTK